MSQLTAKTRIAVGLASLLCGVLLSAVALGFLPDHRVAVIKGRSDLCEALAINTSIFVTQRDTKRVKILLDAVVQRNPDILSAALRRKGGDMVAEVGDHQAHWLVNQTDESTDTQVHVPIRSGKQDWGTVEVRFTPLSEAGVWSFLKSPWFRFVTYATLLSFLVFMFYLGKMLQHLNPSKAVPSRVREALDTLTEGLLVMDKEERIVLANKAFAETVGEEADQLQGRRASELAWTQEESEKTNGKGSFPWLESIACGARKTGVMIGMRDRDEVERTFVCNSSPVCGKDGQDAGVLASFEDVTPLQRTKQELQKSKVAADAANHAKSEFLAGMSHEIRTPLNAILGFADVLRRGYEDNETQRFDYLNTIHSSGQHLLDLINDVLDLSKIEAGKLDLELNPCSIHEICFDVVAVLAVKSEEKSISLSYESDGAIPEVILSDAGRLRQTLMNLVGNAVKFTESGGVRIVSRFLRDGERPQLRIDVIDTGIGMTPQTMERIFDPFVQADNSITRRFGGTGLGLAISRRFARALGGDLSVESEPAEGSTFTVTINIGPVDHVPMVDSETARQKLKITKVTNNASQLRLPPCRVLVVEDGIENQKLMRLVLSRAGAQVATADNGQLGVEAASSGDFDVVLMDMQMPVMDGYTATRTLREQGYEKPIFALTANALKGDEDKCLAAGCSGFLTKPIDIDTLLRSVAEAMGVSVEVVTNSEPKTASAVTPSSSVEPATSDSDSAGLTGPPLVSTLPLDDAEFCEVVVEFIATMKEKMNGMRQAHASDDMKELANLAHWLKGSGGTAGFAAFTEPAAHLEQLAKGNQQDAVEPAIRELEEIGLRVQAPSSGSTATAGETDFGNDAQWITAPDTEKSSADSNDIGAACTNPLVSTLPTEDPEFCEVVVEFAERLQDKLAQMFNAQAADDLDELAALAHWLKGAGGTSGFGEFTEPAAELERLAKAREKEHLEAVVQVLEALAARIQIPQLPTETIL